MEGNLFGSLGVTGWQSLIIIDIRQYNLSNLNPDRINWNHNLSKLNPDRINWNPNLSKLNPDRIN